jgi:hypothetical protein
VAASPAGIRKPATQFESFTSGQLALPAGAGTGEVSRSIP